MDIFSAWKNCCKVLLREEIGELDDYKSYLSKYVEKVYFKKSALSGKPITISSEEFCKNAKFISHGEMGEYDKKLKALPLNINKIKDIDSILQEMGDNFYYCGDIITGNSQELKNADSCANSSFIYSGNELYDCKFMGYSSVLRFCESGFGSSGGGESKFLIKCFEVFRQTRCMETFRAYTSNDCYYVANTEDCANCMFSFNQRAKRNMIGNLQLTPEKYQQMKIKLIEDIRAELKAKKSLPTIVDLIRD